MACRSAGVLALALAAYGCGGGGNSSSDVNRATVVCQWNETLVQAIRNTRSGPTVTSRALAIVHTSMFDAWAAYDSVAVGTRLGGTLRRPEAERTEANKRMAVSFAAYRAMVNLFPTQTSLFNQKMSKLGYNPADTTNDTTTPQGIGNVAAAAVIAYRATDGANQAGGYADTTGYSPVNSATVVNNIDRWQPLTFILSNGTTVTPGFLTPHWGQVRPFALTSGSQFRAPGPMLSSDPDFQERAEEILNIQRNLTDEQKMISEFWSQNPGTSTPPGLWCELAEWVSLRDNHTLDEDVKLYFILANALLDSSIGCWDTKRHFDSSRPVTVIRELFRNQTINAWAGPGLGNGPILGQNWRPYQPLSFLTPPFAEYTSGHSTFSAAAAEILKRFTGSDEFGYVVTFQAGSSFVEPGVTPRQSLARSWATFTDAANDAGMSRLYGGIHFMDGNVDGQAMGRQIAGAVWAEAQTYINGSGVVDP